MRRAVSQCGAAPSLCFRARLFAVASDPANLTLLLERWRDGDEDAAAQLLREVYGDLRRVAGAYMQRERPDHTLQATALLNEAWLRLAQSAAPPIADRHQFFRAMAAYMRRHLVDHARRRNADKRGGGREADSLDDGRVEPAAPMTPEDGEAQLQALDRAMDNLRRAHPRAAKVVELRVFAGQSIDEVAAALSLGSGTVKRDFAFAKSFLLAELHSERDHGQ